MCPNIKYTILPLFYDLTTNEIDFIVDKLKGYEVKKTATAVDLRRARKTVEKLKLDAINVISQNYAENIENLKFAQFL